MATKKNHTTIPVSKSALFSIRSLLQSSLKDIDTGDPDGTYYALTPTEREAVGDLYSFREIYAWLK